MLKKKCNYLIELSHKPIGLSKARNNIIQVQYKLRGKIVLKKILTIIDNNGFRENKNCD